MSLLWVLTTWCYSYAKIVTTKSYMQFNQCLAFEPHEPYVILAEYEMYLRLPLHFIWIKIPDGYQIASLEKSLGLCSTSQLSLWIWSFRLKNGESFRCLLSKVISFILSSLYNKHCLLILPLFVAICEIWLPGLTYGVYLVLFLKPGATMKNQIKILCLYICLLLSMLNK
jgi:hypothetical protein